VNEKASPQTISDGEAHVHDSSAWSVRITCAGRPPVELVTPSPHECGTEAVYGWAPQYDPPPPPSTRTGASKVGWCARRRR